jgi:CheY-like chemotaxis protein
MRTILIVDQHRINRQSLVSLFATSGHRVIGVATGTDALAAARIARPDLVVSEVAVPRMDGYELLRNLYSDPTFAQTQVIFYTTIFQQEEARLLAQACGVSFLAITPAERQAVLSVIESTLATPTPHAPLPPAHDDEVIRRHLQLMSYKLHLSALEFKSRNPGMGKQVTDHTGEMQALDWDLLTQLTRQKRVSGGL